MSLRRAGTPILFLAGLVLILLQSFLVREFSAALISCELTILIVTAAYWSGISLGFALSHRLTERGMRRLVLVTLALQYVLSIARLWPLAGLWLGIRGWWILLWLYGLALPLPVCYSMVLPRAIAQGTAGGLSRAYQVELLGALAGLGLLLGLSRVPGPWLWWVYLACVTALTGLLVTSRITRVAVIALFLAYLPSSGAIHAWQTRQFYALVKRVPIKEIVHSSDSPYQKVELIRDLEGGTRCFLNGMEYFNTKDLEAFNVLLSAVPAKLTRPTSVLIVGSGSMSSVAHVAPYAATITTVEIDRRVYDVSRAHLVAYNHLDQLPAHRLVIDDAKHFLRTTPERFDLIILDLPAPFYIQTGLLFTQEFYALVRQHLRPGGVVSLYASGWFVERNPIARQVVAGVAQVFPDFFTMSEFSLGVTFVVAGERLPFDQHALARELTEVAPEDTIWIYSRRQAVHDVIKATPPLSVRHPRAILQINAWLLEQLWNRAPVSLRPPT